MNHEQTLEVITERLLGGNVAKEKLQAAISHAAECGECLRQLDVTAKLFDEESELLDQLASVVSCRHCAAHMAELAELADEADAFYPLEMRHIQSCPQCSKQYQDLLELLELSAEAPDVAKSADQSQPLWSMCEGVRRLAHVVEIIAGAVGVRLDGLPEMLTPHPLPPAVPAGAMVSLRSVDREPHGWMLDIPDDEKQCSLYLEMKPGPRGRIQGLVRVKNVDSGKHLAITELRARVAENRWRKLLTKPGRNATVRFFLTGNPETIRVLCEEQIWEIPIRIQREVRKAQ